MEYRTLGRSNLRVSVLALGTVELGLDYGIKAPNHFGRPAVADAVRLVHAALDRGITLIDTARGYGESETVLGEALAGKRADVVLATKASAHHPDGTVPTEGGLREHLIAQLETSLRTLQTDYIDLWQIHNVDEAVLSEKATIADLFAEVKAAGKVRAVGGSFYGTALPEIALAQGWLDVIQVTYSVFDQRIADRLLPLASEQNIGVMVRSVLLKGALTERADYLPDHLDPLRQHSQEWRRRVAELLPDYTVAQAALAFALANPHLQSILIGMRTVEELEDNLVALQANLSPTVLDALTTFRLDDEGLLNPGTWGIP